MCQITILNFLTEREKVRDIDFTHLFEETTHMKTFLKSSHIYNPQKFWIDTTYSIDFFKNKSFLEPVLFIFSKQLIR